MEHIKDRVLTELLSLPHGPTTPEAAAPAVQVRQEEPEEDEPGPSAPAAQPVPQPKKRRSLSSFFSTEGPVSLSVEDKIKAELTAYLMILNVKEDVNPLEWWRKHEEDYQRVGKLAKKYLSIPATSASSERLFSVTGNIVTCKRASLLPDAVDRLAFLSKNMQRNDST